MIVYCGHWVQVHDIPIVILYLYSIYFLTRLFLLLFSIVFLSPINQYIYLNLRLSILGQLINRVNYGYYFYSYLTYIRPSNQEYTDVYLLSLHTEQYTLYFS